VFSCHKLSWQGIFLKASTSMLKLITLLLLFIVLDIAGASIPIYLMNIDKHVGPLTLRMISEGIYLRLIFGFWYLVIAYSSWFLINIFAFLFFPRSIMRSIAVSLCLPLFIIRTLSEVNLVTVWYCLLIIAYGLLFHQYVGDKKESLHIEDSDTVA
jgi:hypothetical protein